MPLPIVIVDLFNKSKQKNIMKEPPNRSFKGWVIPGPVPPGARTPEAGAAPGPGETLDALCGHFRIYQLKKGHRYSSDDVLTAWYGTAWCPSARTVLDLGSGIGSVGM